MRKSVLLFFLLSLLSLLIIHCNRRAESQLHERLSQMAKELNESTPVMLDSNTRFDEATVTKENLFRYRYTVLNTHNPDSLLSDRLQTLTDNIRIMFSTNDELAIFRENNVVLEYIYNDEQQQTIRTITIKPEDYQ